MAVPNMGAPPGFGRAAPETGTDLRVLIPNGAVGRGGPIDPVAAPSGAKALAGEGVGGVGPAPIP